MAIPLADIESRHTQKVPRCLALHGISKRGGRDEAPEEPVFAARTGAARDEGWLIVQCLDGRSERGSLHCSMPLMSIPGRSRAFICHTTCRSAFAVGG